MPMFQPIVPPMFHRTRRSWVRPASRPAPRATWALLGALLVLAAAVPGRAAAVEPLRYTGSVDFDPAAGRLSADLDLRLPLDDDPNDVPGTLQFFFNSAFEIERLDGPAVTAYELEPMPGNPAWSILEVAFEPGTADGLLVFGIRYAGIPVMPENGINRISERWIELTVDSAWHPVVSSLLRPIDADLELSLAPDWTVITSGEVEASESGFRLRSRFPQPDIAFTAATGLETRGDDAIRIHYRAVDEETVDHVLGRAAACRDWLNARFGPDRRLPPIRFTITDREEGGYARSNYIALTNVRDATPEKLTAFLCHELGHYWSRGAPPMSVENWLNEAFAVMLGAMATQELYGEEAYAEQLEDWIERSQDAGTIWTPDDLARRSYVVNYKKGPWFLHRLRQRIGMEAFDTLLRRYGRAPIDTTPGLLAALESIAGPEAHDWARTQLGVEGPFADEEDTE